MIIVKTSTHPIIKKQKGKAITVSKLIDKMILNRLSVDFQNKKGETPLHIACMSNKPNNVLLLLSKGSNPKIKTM